MWASLLRTWTRPRSAIASIPAAICSRRKKSAVAWISAPLGNQRRHPLEHVGGEVALGVGDDRPVAALGEVPNPPQEAVAERPGRRLEQDPVALPERDLRQLLGAQRLQRGLGHLAALEDPHRHHFPLQPLVQAPHPAGQLLDPHVVVVADVRGGADRLDPVGLGLPGHRDAVVGIAGPVVDRVEDVAVEVDQASPPDSYPVLR